jgi:hypothetical protein
MSMKANVDQLDRLVSKVINDPLNDKTVKKLLDLFHEGASPVNLLPLIHSSDVHVVEVGTWIASEMGNEATPILSEIVRLLSKGIRGISFDALDCLTSCVTSSDPELILEGLRQLCSTDSAIVWKAQMFLCSLSDESIAAVVKHAIQLGNEEIQLRGLSLLTQTHTSPTQVLESLESSDQLLRAYAAVAALKMSKTDSIPMTKALNASDEIVSEFAKSAVKLGLANFTLH